MRPLRYSINLTLDGCYDHRVGLPTEAQHRYSAEIIGRADALLFGRVTYQMMEEAWRPPGESGQKADWMTDWMMPFAQTIHKIKKYVVSSQLTQVDWNAELVRGDLKQAVQALKQLPGRGLYVGGATLPFALAKWGLIDEYEFIMHPRVVGHGPALFAGLPKPLDLKLIGRTDVGDGIVALRYQKVR